MSDETSDINSSSRECLPASALAVCCSMYQSQFERLAHESTGAFSKLDDNQLELTEAYRIAQAEHCRLGKASLALLLDANKASGTMLKVIQPESWQTGLEDSCELYSNRWKEMVRHYLGHNDHDRNSVRDYNTRFTLPMRLKDLEGLDPLSYCVQHCILSTEQTALYNRTFNKMRENRRPKLNHKALLDAINTLVGSTMTDDQKTELLDLFDIQGERKSLSMEEFSLIGAVAERLYFQQNLRTLSEESQQMQRSPMEIIDFHQFNQRSKHIKMSTALRQFLERLATT